MLLHQALVSLVRTAAALVSQLAYVPGVRLETDVAAGKML